MNDDLFLQGVELMLVGMGAVFVFLTTLVIATSLMSAIVMRRTPPAPAVSAQVPNDEEIAAMTAAIDKHRRR